MKPKPPPPTSANPFTTAFTTAFGPSVSQTSANPFTTAFTTAFGSD